MSSAATVQPPGQPQAKAAPIAQLSRPLTAQADNEVAARASESSRSRSNRPVKEANPNDAASLATTIALIQRVLAPDQTPAGEGQARTASIEDILPPLTSSNEVDIELYAILAVVIKEFVNTWYTKITTDHGFVEEIIQIVAHCSRALEQRLRRVDVASLMFDETPILVRRHVEAYRVAEASSSSSPYGPRVRHIYHELSPHPALTLPPSDADPLTLQRQQENESAYRQLLVQGTLAVLLPTEDMQNGPLRALVGDIIADLIVGQALAGKVCEDWFLHEAITKVSAVLSDKVQPKTTDGELHDEAKNRLEKFGLLSSEFKSQNDHSSEKDQSKIAAWLWRIMQYGYLAYLFLRYVLKEFQVVHRMPLRQHSVQVSNSSPLLSEKSHMQSRSPDDHPPRPVLDFGLSSMISTLLKMDDRMPWLASIMLYWQQVLLYGIGQIGGSNTALDRFLYHTLKTHVLPASLMPLILRNLRTALFPKNVLGPPAPPPPSVEERRKIKRNAAKSIFRLLPGVVARRYYAAEDEEVIIGQIEEDLLNPFEDQYLNKHLVYGLLELILIRLIPELGEQSISELLAERGVVLGENVVGQQNEEEDVDGFQA